MTMLRRISYLIQQFPGEERFGFYRFLPFFFLCGASIEYAMIHWHPNGNNFYKTYKRNQVHDTAVRQLQLLGELES